jgi:Alpha/beta hydrolase family
MATFVLVPGAGGHAAYWALLVPELQRRGHQAIAVDIAENDPVLGLPEYAQMVEQAIGDHRDVVLVAQSLAGFTAPMVRKPVAMIVLLNAMIPVPGETPGQWFDNTGAGQARRAADQAAGRSGDFDTDTHFLHDLSAQALAVLTAAGPPREPADTPFGQPCAFQRWPDIPVKVLTGAADRFFPAEFQRRIAKERLGIDLDLIPGGHLVALSNPAALAERLDGYAAELPGRDRTPIRRTASPADASAPAEPVTQRTRQGGRQPSSLPAGLAKPAQRALAAAGYTTLDQLTQVREQDLSRLHGMGPKAVRQLREALAAAGLSFATKN